MKKIILVALSAIIALTIGSCGGDPAQTESSYKPTSNVPPTGEAIYKKTCITCHQANGEGLPNTYPPLAKSDFLGNNEKTIAQVIKGFSGELIVNGRKFNSSMPPQQLTDDEIAAVLTYVNSNFGNSGAAVTVDEVKKTRAGL